ncbi:tRNA (adenosine(37)-N6)-dimethylallyltransferase MiaA [Granulicoccus phenolivorans]|uniref:tRNA (adenosine(37)-N6)-dimethylallyltransferase MiaA n=1 Tax=Granulicoccus phenolivorans TaxID=266854 RepID=UPI0003FFB368|nr:tRNA (adenosine(37)-N6)-dimethylallyltransferase MiaA [Granulicoccus phenolivorans]
MTPRTLVFVGPTASGKTALAIQVAEALAETGQPAEIVNADSMLVYRGMDIGTAKPSPAERARVRHHLIDILEITETATVAHFQDLARAAIADCHRRGVLPILVGGSALYTRAIVDRFEFPGTDPQVRAYWEAELERRGSAELYRELQRQSPAAAAEMLPANGRRIVRALEVIQLTGRWVPTLPSWEYALPGVVQIGLALDRELMDRRIAERVDRMWAAGLVEEVRGLVARGLREGRTASRALGYRQVLDFLDGGCTEEQAREATVAGTRRFARKQLGWYRRDDRIHWLTAGHPDNCARVLRLLGE